MTTLSPSLADRMVDAIARRPSGVVGRALYRRPVGHIAGFRAGLDAVPVTPTDHVLDVGCGGGVFLEMALSHGCRATGLDHSADMVAETRRRNAEAVAEGRLEVRQGDAAALPFPEATFTAVFCMHAFFFFPRPAEAVAEMARVLVPGGRVAIMTSSPPTARWVHWVFRPITRRMRFDTPETLIPWTEAAGLVADGVYHQETGGLLFVARKPA